MHFLFVYCIEMCFSNWKDVQSTFYLCLLHRDVCFFFLIEKMYRAHFSKSRYWISILHFCDCFIVFVVMLFCILCFSNWKDVQHIWTNLDIGCKGAFWSFIATFPSLMCPNQCAAVTCSYFVSIFEIFQNFPYISKVTVGKFSLRPSVA